MGVVGEWCCWAFECVPGGNGAEDRGITRNSAFPLVAITAEIGNSIVKDLFSAVFYASCLEITANLLDSGSVYRSLQR